MHDEDQTATAYSLHSCLFSEPLTQILIVGDLPQEWSNTVTNDVTIHQVANLNEAEQHVMQAHTGNEPPDHTTQVLVLALNPEEAHFEQCLGRAVRAFPHRVLLHCTTTEAKPGRADDAFFAFGFRKLTIVQDESLSDVTVKWFEYRLSQYKPAPDWLNAQFWANPDRFDLDGDLDDYCEDDEEE